MSHSVRVAHVHLYGQSQYPIVSGVLDIYLQVRVNVP